MALTQTRVGLAATFVLTSAGFLGTANAQDGLVALEEIVVTARKVEERLQDVPLAITAFSAAEIQAAGIENLDDVANFTPGMTLSNRWASFFQCRYSKHCAHSGPGPGEQRGDFH